MKTAEVSSIVFRKLKPLGATRKGRSTFVLETPDLLKSIDVQKSDFSQRCYLNYAFTLKRVPTGGLKTHLMKGATSKDPLIKEQIDHWLDLESDSPDPERAQGIEWIIDEIVLPEIQTINTESDLKKFILTLPTMNLVPIHLREHYGL
jgi:hypothetical protein